MRKKNTKITENELRLVHTLMDAGIKKNEIAKIAHIGIGTVYYLSISNSMEEYHQNSNSRTRKKKETPAVTVEETTEAADIIPNGTTETVNQIIEYRLPELERMAIALERMADAWESTPKKKWGIK